MRKKHCMIRYEGKKCGSTHTFSFSPGPHRRPAALRSTTGPLSRSKLHTTISFTHLLIRRLVSSSKIGGGLGSPGRRLKPSLALGFRVEVADRGPGLEPSSAERSAEGMRMLRDLERPRELPELCLLHLVGVTGSLSSSRWLERPFTREAADDGLSTCARGVTTSVSSSLCRFRETELPV